MDTRESEDGMGRIVIGVAGSVVAAALLAGCQSRQVMVMNHGDD